MDRLTKRVAELRVHGVSGTPPAAMLGELDPAWVAGDTMGRIYRKREPVAVDGFRPRVVEAYHWGRYTAGSASRALWLLLLPFAVINLAHFALLSPQPSRKGRVAELVLRLLGLVLTLALVVTTCYVAWAIVARQCGPAGCGEAPGWVGAFKDRPLGLRVLITAVVPAVMIGLLWTFGRRPPDFAPAGSGPEPLRPVEAGEREVHQDRTEPAPDKDRLGNASFWLGALTAPQQRAAHVSASCAVTGVLALSTVGSWHSWAPAVPGYVGAIYVALLVAAGVTGGLALGVVIVDQQPGDQGTRLTRIPLWLFSGNTLAPDPWRRDSVRIPRRQSLARWAAMVTAAACLAFAVVVAHRSWPEPGTEPRTGSAPVAFEVAVAFVGLAAGLLLPVLLLISALLARDSYGRQVRHGGTDESHPPVPSAFRPYYAGLGAPVLAALAVTVGFGFSTAAVWWSADLLGTPDRPGGRLDDRIEVATGYWTSAAVWGAITVAILVTAVPLAAWLMRRLRPGVMLLVLAVTLVSAAGVAGLDRGARLFCLGLLVLGILGPGVRLLPIGRRDYERQVGADYSADYSADGVERPAEYVSVARVARSWRIAMIKYRYHHVLALVATVGGVAAVAWAGLCITTWVQNRAAPPAGDEAVAEVMVTASVWSAENADRLLGTLTGLGITSASVTAAGLVWLGISTWRKPKVRTVTGILWDMLSFWPRVAHPLCPLPYGGRAVRAVARRTSELMDQDLDVDGPDVRSTTGGSRNFDAVVLSGHSQGSVITLAACAVLLRSTARNGILSQDEARRAWANVRLVTYGSQLQFIYARMFPSYLGFQVQQDLFRDLGGRWRNVYRWTDPLGGPVLSWPTGAEAAPEQRFGPTVQAWTTAACGPGQGCDHPTELTTATRPGFRRWAIGPDIRLRDPGLIEESPYAPRISALGHSGYLTDPGFDVVVAELGAAEAAEISCRQ